MKLEDVVSLTEQSVAQTLGHEYMEQAGSLAALPMEKLIDVGRDVTEDGTVEKFTKTLVSLLGKMVIDSRSYTRKLKSLYIDNMEWGGFIERVYFDLADIVDDPMLSLTNGTDYSEIEHKFYQPKTSAKIFEEGKGVMTPISINKDLLREAFYSWDKLNAYISGIHQMIKNTLEIALESYEKMLVCGAIAVSDKALHSSIHLISEAVAEGILEQVEESGSKRNPTIAEIKATEETYVRFLKYCSMKIKTTRDNFAEPTQGIYNNGNIPTWDDNPNLVMLNHFSNEIEFNVKADTFNPEMLGIGLVDRVTSWQAVKDSNNTFDFATISSIKLKADNTEKLGIGKQAVTLSNVVGLLYDTRAIGLTLMKNKVTSGYTACADFWNEFHHMLLNYILDSNFGIVAFILD